MTAARLSALWCLCACDQAGYSLRQISVAEGYGHNSPTTTTPTTTTGDDGPSTVPTDSTTTPTTKPTTDPTTTPTTNPTTPASGCTTTADTWDNYAGAVMTAKCGPCHGSEFTSRAAVQSKQSAARGYISAKAMPPNASDLPDADRKRIVAWLNCPNPLP